MAFRLPAPRSLYWRIALASLGLLLVALVVQMAVFVATLTRPSGLRARVVAQQIADVVAADLADALEIDPAADVRDVLREATETQVPAFFVASNGAVTSAGRGQVPGALARRLIELAEQSEEVPERPIGVARVEVVGQLEGHVVVLPQRPGWGVVRELGPWALGGAALAAIGVAALLAWMAFAPAHRRLRALESAATRLGSGDLTARAPEHGADEISHVAHAFNRTADALSEQIERVLSEQEVRRRLLADVSHELRTPLTTIRGYVETLRMRDIPISDADRSRYLAIVDDEAVRLERLVGDLLDLARMESGARVLERTTTPISALWDRLRDRHGPAAAMAGVSLEFEPTTAVVDVDAGRIEQALSNLVANAVRFTPSGGSVRVRAASTPTGTRFEVADTGAGLAPEQQARIFDRFYKQDGSRAGGGTGLGLAIVRAVAEAHGGSASVTSTPGAGSTFTVDVRAE